MPSRYWGSEQEGMRFGSLVVMKRPTTNPLKYHQNLCKCDCGNVLIVTTHMLETGKTTDCGCVKRDRKTNAMYPERIKGLDNLANAIIAKAADDYRQAVMVNLKNGSTGELLNLRRFFRSSWCMILTDLNTDALMKEIEQECIAEFERKKKHGHKNQVPEGHSAD